MNARLASTLIAASSCLALFASAIHAQPATATGQALAAASYDGQWSGRVECLHDPGLWPEDECGIGLDFAIHGSQIEVTQAVRSKKGRETRSKVNPGTFRFARLATNAVAVSLNTGDDEDGTWVETWSFAMTLEDADHMLVHWTRIVNNLDMPPGRTGSKFSSVGMGELVRIGARD